MRHVSRSSRRRAAAGSASPARARRSSSSCAPLHTGVRLRKVRSRAMQPKRCGRGTVHLMRQRLSSSGRTYMCGGWEVKKSFTARAAAGAASTAGEAGTARVDLILRASTLRCSFDIPLREEYSSWRGKLESSRPIDREQQQGRAFQSFPISTPLAIQVVFAPPPAPPATAGQGVGAAIEGERSGEGVLPFPPHLDGLSWPPAAAAGPFSACRPPPRRRFLAASRRSS
mmetsp:Transcript_26569/g.74649  ORF Transcript_26569/g.74649 Transcript_26569/m.74649 type:complete len:228 (-) Transcript_26569:209-892(-)